MIINIENLNIDYQLKKKELLEEQIFIENNSVSNSVMDDIDSLEELEKEK